MVVIYPQMAICLQDYDKPSKVGVPNFQSNPGWKNRISTTTACWQTHFCWIALGDKGCPSTGRHEYDLDCFCMGQVLTNKNTVGEHPKVAEGLKSSKDRG